MPARIVGFETIISQSAGKKRNNEAAIESKSLSDMIEADGISSYERKIKHKESTVGVKENLCHHCFNNITGK